MQRILLACLTTLLFWGMLPTTFAAGEDACTASKAPAAFTYDTVFSATVLADEGNENNDACTGCVHLFSLAVQATDAALRPPVYGGRYSTAYSIRAPPQHL
ncbi:hypothetical protein BJB45_08505 [Halomonas huangheensis]|uniref:Uncharacterized protein n=1 Tax=Halomonas huangheensis TaxID=1178482 RepID=W1NAN0_9GAMM|nr:hypothetical protein AR456_18465 [Halomonas huangheensis]ERL52584.1 hypothetical protein BJB45_08505 [Halomonas huangheensis]